MIAILEEDRRRRFFPKCPVIEGLPETQNDREFLEMEQLRLKLDNEALNTEGALALRRESRKREKKRKAQAFFREKKAEKMLKAVGRLPFCELVDGEYIFHPLEIPAYEGPRKLRKFMTLEEFQEAKANRTNDEWWVEGMFPGSPREQFSDQEWVGEEGGLDES